MVEAQRAPSWECGACTLVNEGDCVECLCCGSPQARWQGSDDDRVALGTARSLEGTWDCRQCAQEANPRGAGDCEGCGTRRKRRRDPVDTVDLTGGVSGGAEADDPALTLALAQSLEGCWDCACCGEVNPSSAERCLQSGCQTYRHRSARMAAAAEAQADAATADPAAAARCGLPGCGRDAEPGCFGFCGAQHRARAGARNLLAPGHPGVERVYVDQASGEWTAHLLTKRHPHRATVAQRFLSAWRKPQGETGRPRIQRIFCIRAPPSVYIRFRDRSAAVGNVVERFHGTGLDQGCNFGVDLQSEPCGSAACGVCNICRMGFALDRAGATGGQRMNLRYGRGLYFSDTSGKSNDYNQASERRRNISGHGGVAWRAMFLCQVVAGRTHRTTDASIEEPQIDELIADGQHDSVTGEVGPHLNFDELVVYDEAAAVPNYLIIYALTPS